MRPFSFPLMALAIVGKTVASPVAAESSIPDLPDGFFSGYNNADGTNTLIFRDLNQTFTFVPRPALVDESPQIEKRQSESDCWNYDKLNVAGVDDAIRQLREYIGYYGVLVVGNTWGNPAYFGFNSGGVYAYFCWNTDMPLEANVNMRALDRYTSWMDRDCGPYMPGYSPRDSWILFGKCKSGTPVCLGNPRSPRP
ncbi:hypothetical protein B0I35DRAFT_441300 [Stachybotrys elegans]|uniref:Ecp2 effector protein domain-containing protein n=1 Tax=Stachybotrys elegans TaxID=80388 RepID=A0A8K0WLF9_9HYPO|nr:hypothetical protein B0I35DRAFT_441300 [Stachybotrys elegans]